MGQLPRQLDYAGTLRWWETRRFYRVLRVAGFVVVSPFVAMLVLWVVVWAHRTWEEYQASVVFEACAEYVPPPEQVVLEWRDGRLTHFKSAPPWLRQWSPAQSHPTVFLHKLHDSAPPDAHREAALVVVEAQPWLMHTYDGRTILDRPVVCFVPGQMIAPSSNGGPGVTSGSTRLVMLPEPGDHIRVFAGEVTGDGTFRFEVDYNGHRQSVDGSLTGGLVKLDPTAGETLRPDLWRYASFWTPEGSVHQQAERTRAVAASGGTPAPTTWTLPKWWVVPQQVDPEPGPDEGSAGAGL